MLRCYRFRVYPTRRERRDLNMQMLLAKELYNLILEKAKCHYKETGKTFTRNMMNIWITDLKKEKPEFNKVYSQVLQNVADRVAKAYLNFFRRVNQKKSGMKIKAGFPRSRKFVQSLTYPQFGFAVIQERKRIELSTIGRIPTVFDRKIRGSAKTLTIKKARSGEWYASVLVSIEDNEFVSNKKGPIGIDLGLESYATLSNGEKVQNARIMDESLARLRRKHRIVSRRKKGGANRRKAVVKLARVSEHIARQRDDSLHKLSHKLVNSYSLIAYERLNIKDMLKNRHLSRSISDASWANFIRMVCYKAESAGCRTIGVDPRGTSKRCSRCGNEREIPLSERVYNCMKCSLSIDRDINAAINILNRATAGHAGIYASGDTVTTAERSAANSVDEPGTIYRKRPVGNPRL